MLLPPGIGSVKFRIPLFQFPLPDQGGLQAYEEPPQMVHQPEDQLTVLQAVWEVPTKGDNKTNAKNKEARIFLLFVFEVRLIN
jgi:hypothetical protein